MDELIELLKSSLSEEEQLSFDELDDNTFFEFLELLNIKI